MCVLYGLCKQTQSSHNFWRERIKTLINVYVCLNVCSWQLTSNKTLVNKVSADTNKIFKYDIKNIIWKTLWHLARFQVKNIFFSLWFVEFPSKILNVPSKFIFLGLLPRFTFFLPRRFNLLKIKKILKLSVT